MEQLTGLGKTIIATDQDRIRLDRAVKNILAYKPLLARIFKETVEECMNMSPKEIEDCIEGDVLVGKVYVDSGLSNAVLVNISGKHDTGNTDNELIKMLTDLFDERIGGADKIKKLKDTYGLELTKEVDEEVSDMCSYATAIENKGIQQGIQQGEEQKQEDNIKQLAEYFMSQDDKLTKEEATQMAKGILK